MIKIDFVNAGQPAINDTNLNQMQNNIETAIDGAISGDTLPIGSQIPYGNSIAPTNWLNCNGQAVSRTEYAELFAVIGISYGEGDGSTTFNLPDKRKRTSVGLDTTDTDLNAIGKKLGEKEHTLIIDEIPSHIHSLRSVKDIQGTDSSNNSGEPKGVNGQGNNQGYTGYSDNVISSTGGGQAHNNMQPSEVDNWIIKAKQSAGVVATVVDNLNSTSATDALSANQGKVLNEKIEQRIVTGQEFATNEYIDGSRVYCKKLNFDSVVSGASIPHGLTNFNLINLEVISIDTSGIRRKLNYTTSTFFMVADVNDNNIMIFQDGSQTITGTATAFLYYTKNS